MIRLSGFILLLACAPLNAATVTLFGTDLKFTFDDASLYGEGYVVGNSLFFMPTTFRAESANATGLVQVSESLQIIVETTNAATAMTSFGLAEQGDYRLDGASTSVSATGQFDADSNTNAFSDSNALSAGPLTVQGAQTEWVIQSVIDLAGTAGWDQDTAVTLTLENDLQATSNVVGDSAWIEKKFGAFGVHVAIVPIPAAGWLFVTGLTMLGWLRRKTR